MPEEAEEMSDEKALIPVEQKQVLFYDDQLIAVRGDDGHVYVAIGQMCDALGLDRASQVRRIRSDDVMREGYRGSVNLTYPGGGTQPSGVLRVDLLPLWLTGIRVKAVRDEIRPKLDRFKRDAAKILWEAFQEGRLTASHSFDDLLAGASPETIQAYQVAQAVLQLARNQVMLEARLRGVLDDHEMRLEAVEAQLRLGSARYVTEEQASQISQAVKAVALVMTKRSGSNQFGSVYGELYRKFGVTGYKMLPARRFDEAMKFLTDWHEELVGEGPF